MGSIPSELGELMWLTRLALCTFIGLSSVGMNATLAHISLQPFYLNSF
jgi:hypothetical protein